MAVSYLSRPIESNPYVVPVDLNLLAKVNQYKQSIFYQNADRVGQELNQINNTDIFKDNERQYMKDKVNGLVKGINDMGGLDYSDMNVSNTIENYGSQIYNDPNILTAIQSTRAVRTYLNNSETIKNDPKLNKFYDPAREWYDTQYALNPNSIINYKNSAFGQGYNGPTAPTPYLGNDFDLIAANVTKLDPNITESYGPSGNPFFLDKTTGTEVSPERIRALVDGHIDGKLADQLNVHAAYNYYGLTNGTYSKEQGASEYTQYAQSLVDQANTSIATLQHDIKTEPDNGKRAQLQQRLDDIQNNYLPQYQKALETGKQQFSKQWDQSPESAMYVLYKNKLIDDVTHAYSYTQTKHQLVVDQQAVYNAKLQMEALKKGKKLHYNADGTATFEDPLADPQKPTMSNLEVNHDADTAIQQQAITQQTLTNDIQAIRQDQSNKLLDLIGVTAEHNGVQGLVDYNTTTINNDPTAQPVSHPDLVRKIAMLDGDPTLTEADITAAIDQNNPQDAAHKFGVNKNMLVNLGTGGTPKVYLTPEQVQFFQKIKTVMDAGANGKDITGFITDAPKWRDYLNQYSIQQNSIKNKQALIGAAHKQFLEESTNLNNNEKAAVLDYLNNPEKYVNFKEPTKAYGNPGIGSHINVGESTFTGDTTLATAINKLGGINNINKSVNSYLDRTATRKNFYNILMPDSGKEVGEQFPQLKNYILRSIDKKETGKEDIGVKKIEDVHPTAIVTDGTDYYIAYNDASNISNGTGYVKVEPQDVAALKIPVLPYPELEQTVTQHGKLFEPIYINPTATGNKFNTQNGFTAPVKIQVHNMNRTGSSLNANNFEASIIYNNKEYYVAGSNNPTANGALEIAKRLIQENTTWQSLDQMVRDLNYATNNQ